MNEELKQELTDIKRTITVMLKNVWSVADLSLVLDVSESRVRHMAAESVIPCYKQTDYAKNIAEKKEKRK